MNKPQGLLACPCCLKAACVLIVAIIVLGGVVLWWLPQALASSGVTLTACARSTCAGLDTASQAALGFTGEVIVQAEGVRAISGIPQCTGCSKIIDERGRGFIVQGSPDDVACKIFGGSTCKAR